MLENIRLFSFSGHAPRKTLQEVIDAIKPKNVIFVHGDPEAITWMKENAGAGYNAFAPAIGDSITLEP